MSESRRNAGVRGKVTETHEISRRAVLKGGGATLTLGMLAGAFGAALPRDVKAQASAASVNVLTILYPSGEGVEFDFDYYRDKHLKMFMSLQRDAVERFELRRVIAPPMPPGIPAPPPGSGFGPKLPFSAIATVWVKDMPTFAANSQKHANVLSNDVPRFTNGKPIIQFERFAGAMGAARDAPKRGDRCLNMLYPNGQDVLWDVEKYRTGHMPLIMNLYGKEAIRRFELRKGEYGAAPGTQPTYIGVVAIYVANQEKMQAAGREHGRKLMEEARTVSSVGPTTFPSIIWALA